jgi:hypothetical protein
LFAYASLAYLPILAGCVTLFFLVREALRWWFSFTLMWPAGLPAMEQGRIGKKYFRRHGIRATNPHEIFTGIFDLDLFEHPNRVLISFRSKYFTITEFYLRELFKAHEKVAGPNTVIIVTGAEISPESVTSIRRYPFPVLRPAQLKDLRMLLRAKDRNLRQTLMALSPPFISPENGPHE